MTLDDLFKDLSFGPAANLALMGEGSGITPETSYPRIINAINASLTELYTRFQIRQKTIVVRAIEGRYLYPLKRVHAFTDPTPGFDKFIMDGVGDLFMEDILQIQLVSGAFGELTNINDRNSNFQTVFIPSASTIQLVEPGINEEFMVEYRAGHPKLALETTDLASVQVDVPQVYLPAFLEHVAGKIYQSLNGAENTAKGTEHLQEFERLCGNHEIRNTDASHQSSSNDRPAINGWP